MAAVIFTVDAEAATGQPASVQRGDRRRGRRAPRRAHPVRLDRPAPRGGRHPRGPAAGRGRTASAGSSSTRSLLDFVPNDRAVYPLYEELQSLGVPALFHTGQTGIGSGLPGGRGIKLRYSDPMLLDDVAADFPGLTIIMAHPSVPWQDAAIAVARTRPTSTSTCPAGRRSTSRRSWSAPPTRLLKNKVLFGCDYPLIRPERWIRDFDAARIRDEVRPLIMKENAIRRPGRCGEERRAGLLAGTPAADLPRPRRDLVRGDDDVARRVRRPGAPHRRRAGRARRRPRRPRGLDRRQPPLGAGDALRLRAARRDLGAGQRPARRARGGVRAQPLRRERRRPRPRPRAARRRPARRRPAPGSPPSRRPTAARPRCPTRSCSPRPTRSRGTSRSASRTRA